MCFLKKYFYLIMFIFLAFSIFYDIKILQIFIMLIVLVIYYREIEFGNLSSYTKEQTHVAIKRVVKEFFYLLFVTLVIIIAVILLTTNLKKYLVPLYITFFTIFAILAHTIFSRRNVIIRFIEFIFNFFDSHFIFFCLLASIIITKKNLYLYNDLIIILIPIFTFLPPVITLIDNEKPMQKKVVKYTIFLIISLLFIILLNRINVENFYFDMEQGKIIPIFLSLLKLLCTSISYFFIINTTYLSFKFCIKMPNK